MRFGADWALVPSLRRSFVIATVVGLAGVSVAAAAQASREPGPAEVLQYCTAEQVGARKLSDDLRRRERELAAQADALKTQTVEIADAEKRLTERMTELTAMRAELTTLLAAADGERDKRVAGLVKMVEANRAATVAPMFGALESPLAVEVLNRMNRTKAGKLLAALPPEQAAGLAQSMTKPVEVGG